MKYKEITKEQRELLNKALPNEACKKHPSKSFLTSINPIYVIERLNDVFGVGVWQTRTELIENKNSMVVVKVTLNIPAYNIHIEQFGGNDNGGEDKKGFDLGDAYKGAVTDGLTKIASYLEIGISIYKNHGNQDNKSNLTELKEKKEAEIEAYYNKVEAYCRNEAPKDSTNAYYTAIHNKYISKASKLKDDKRFNDLVEKYKPETKEPSNEFEDALNNSKKIA